MRSFKGIIALDIDGTITVSKHSIQKTVSDYLNYLIADHWQLILITGRTFAFTLPMLSCFEGDYLLAVQNGAAVYEMPSEQCVYKSYLDSNLLCQIDVVFRNMGRGLLAESGKDNGDICYFKPQDFSKEELDYLVFRRQISAEKWQEIDSFEMLPMQQVAVGKFFAPEVLALELADKIRTIAPLNVIVIRDPFRFGFHLAHINAFQTSKGTIIQKINDMHPHPLPIIAAGDDYNDVEMLEKSTVKIVMQNSPEALHKLADVLAPPAEEGGIVTGLKEALSKLSLK